MFGNFKSIFICLVIISASLNCFAIQSKIIQHNTLEDFTAEGSETENVIISSDGKILLATDVETLAENFDRAWVANCLAVDNKETIYIGTSPNGEIYKYKNAKLEKIYTAKTEDTTQQPGDVNDVNDPNDPNSVNLKQADPTIANRHIFAMTLDDNGALIAAVSGAAAEIIKFDGKSFDTIAEIPDANYVFKIISDNKDGAYLATGPQGKIYHLKQNGKKYSTKIIYDATDKNILSLALDDNGNLYAGTDERGLVYKIDPAKKTASVLYDSPEEEITSLVLDEDGNLYAAATSQQVAQNQLSQKNSRPSPMMPGRNESGPSPAPSANIPDGMLLKIANTKPDPDQQNNKPNIHANQNNEGPASHIYIIKPDGLVEDAFSKVAVFYDIALKNDKLYIATGNNAQLFTFDIKTKIEAMIFQHNSASQLIALNSQNENLYIASANPAKLLIAKNNFARTGTYISPLIDATQPAKWGSFQLDAQIPPQTSVTFQARTGNTEEPNDSTFSKWNTPIQLDGPTIPDVTTSRFLQYKLTLKTDDFSKTPIITQTASAYVIDNIPPQVTAIQVSPQSEQTGSFLTEFKAEDENGDTLIYDVYLKKISRNKWIKIKDGIEESKFIFNGKKIEDGRYEIKIVASDAPSNDPRTKMTGTRISDIFIIDNTPPQLEISTVQQNENAITVKLHVTDQLSLIHSLQYTINSSDKWQSALPDDMIFDTTAENFTISIDDLQPDTYLITLKATDAADNTTYKSVETTIE